MIKIEHIKEGLTVNIRVETIDRIYNLRFQKYVDYHWIQISIVRNATLRSVKRTRDQLNHINQFHKFLPTAIKDIDLN